MATKTSDRRAFLSNVFKFGAGAAALTIGSGCEAFDASGERDGGRNRRRGCRNKSHQDLEQTTRIAAPAELFEPMTRGFVMGEKWRFEDVVARPDSHLRVRLTDVTTNNPLEIELFRGPDAKKRAIASTDEWEFYTYNADEAGKSTPDHVTDAINQLAEAVLGNEHRPAVRNLNDNVCLFADRQPDAPTSGTTKSADVEKIAKSADDGVDARLPTTER